MSLREIEVMNMSDEKLQEMDDEADSVIGSWTFGALAANLLPPPFDYIAVGAVFARMGARLGEVYHVNISWNILKSIGRSIAKGIGSVLAASYIGTGLLKYVPGVNVWVALFVQPPMVAAVAYSAGKAFKQYYRIHITQGRNLSPDEMRELAEAAIKEKLS